MADEYKKAGVDLQAGYESICEIEKQLARIGPIKLFGKFGGMFDLYKHSYKNPVLISGCDGVGSKLEIAFSTNIHHTIGIDLVAMCVNDILAQGAKPLYFLDYIGIHQVDKNVIGQIVSGIVDGCIMANCELIGGETAEMRDLYKKGQYDLAGFAVGCCEKEKLIDNCCVKPNQTLIGIASSGLHSNGYTLVRKILFTDNNYELDKVYEPFTKPLQEILLTPTKIYVESVLSVLEKVNVFGIVHVTGGGFYENIERVLPAGCGAKICKSSFKILKIFKFLMSISNVCEHEMFNVFNMGIGMILIVDDKDVDETLQILANHNEVAYVIGKVTDQEGVIIDD